MLRMCAAFRGRIKMSAGGRLAVRASFNASLIRPPRIVLPQGEVDNPPAGEGWIAWKLRWKRSVAASMRPSPMVVFFVRRHDALRGRQRPLPWRLSARCTPPCGR